MQPYPCATTTVTPAGKNLAPPLASQYSEQLDILIRQRTYPPSPPARMSHAPLLVPSEAQARKAPRLQGKANFPYQLDAPYHAYHAYHAPFPSARTDLTTHTTLITHHSRRRDAPYHAYHAYHAPFPSTGRTLPRIPRISRTISVGGTHLTTHTTHITHHFRRRDAPYHAYHAYHAPFPSASSKPLRFVFPIPHGELRKSSWRERRVFTAEKSNICRLLRLGRAGMLPFKMKPSMPENTLARNSSPDWSRALTPGSRFVRACLRQPVDRTPVWFLRQAGRYMPEYQAVRKHHSLLEICKQPELAAEVTITAAEKLDVDAAIIFADLLLPLESMGLDFEFQAGEGPVVHHPVRTAADVERCAPTAPPNSATSPRPSSKVAAHFKDRLGIIGFCGAPFTLASYMIEGGGSRNYIHTKTLMYREPAAWRLLLDKLVIVLANIAAQQVEAGADVIQIFDSWAGALSVDRLSRIRAARHHASRPRSAGTRRARHLFRSRHRQPAARHARDRRRRARPRLARAARRGLARARPRLRGAGQPRSHHALRRAKICFAQRVRRFSRRPPAGPGTSSISATASFPERRSKTCSAWSSSSASSAPSRGEQSRA